MKTEPQSIPIGYKQTDVGVIPDDWDVLPIGNLASISVGRDLKEEHFSTYQSDEFQYPVFSNTVANKGLYGFYDLPEYSGDSLTIVGRGVGLGTAFKRSGGYGAIGRLLVLAPNARTHAGFLTEYINHRVHIFSESGGIPQLTGISIAKYRVPLPPTKAEQEAIAKALSDSDSLIEALEQLLVKKRNLKQGAMQELLTGKKRLPGFSEPWKTKQFAEIAQPRTERVDPRRSGPYEFCIELEHIQAGTGQVVGYTQTSESSSLKSVFREDDVLFGKLRAYLRKYWLADRDGVCSTEIWVLTAQAGQVIPAYLFQLVKVDRFIEAASTAYGTHMPRSDWNVVKNYSLSLPSLREQTAIATALIDMDSEIATLEAKLIKSRQIKQGMMQELLTGRIRLV